MLFGQVLGKSSLIREMNLFIYLSCTSFGLDLWPFDQYCFLFVQVTSDPLDQGDEFFIMQHVSFFGLEFWFIIRYCNFLSVTHNLPCKTWLASCYHYYFSILSAPMGFPNHITIITFMSLDLVTCMTYPSSIYIPYDFMSYCAFF